MYTNFNTKRVLRWRLLLEEFGPEIIYVKGSENDVADALSHLPKTEGTGSDGQVTREALADLYGVDKLDDDTFPLKYKIIDKYQQKDPKVIDNLKRAVYQMETFVGAVKKGN